MLDGAVINAISEVCQKSLKFAPVTMSSGAGHDSKEIIYRVPAGMIFVPSEGGISHSPREYTTEAQIEKGTRVLYQTLILMDKMKWGEKMKILVINPNSSIEMTESIKETVRAAKQETDLKQRYAASRRRLPLSAVMRISWPQGRTS